jgi:hypothetical protein
MALAALNLSMVRGKTGIFFLSVYQSDGVTPQSLAGAVLWFHAAVRTFSVSKNSPASGITIQNSSGGLNCATLQLEPSDTTALSTAVYVMPCERVLQSGGEDYALNTGTLTVTPNVGAP